MAAISTQTAGFSTKMAEAKAVGDQAATAVYARQLQQLFKENKCSPFGGLWLPLTQMPMFISFFFAVRQMSYLPVPQFKEGGALWFQDLTAADPYYILPVLSMGLQTLVLKYGSDGMGGAATQTRSQQHIKNGLQVMIMISVPFIATMPAVSDNSGLVQDSSASC